MHHLGHALRRHREPACLKHLQHRRVLRQDLGSELLQVGPSGERDGWRISAAPIPCPW
jgi:hypothetical protein